MFDVMTDCMVIPIWCALHCCGNMSREYSCSGVLSVSWYPPGLADDEGDNVDAVIPQLLEAAQKYDLKVGFLNQSFIT
jgi:hypothetical protein